MINAQISWCMKPLLETTIVAGELLTNQIAEQLFTQINRLS